MDETTEELTRFFEWFWHDTTAFVYVPVMQISTDKWVKAMFDWPRQKAGVVRHVLKYATDPDVNVFFSPAMFKATSPKKEFVLGSWCLWADFDGNAPTEWPEGAPVPPPSMIVQSSIEGHEHTYWGLNDFLNNIELLEDRNRAIALALQADTSGWDADQILRPIHTINRKRNVPVVLKSAPDDLFGSEEA